MVYGMMGGYGGGMMGDGLYGYGWVFQLLIIVLLVAIFWWLLRGQRFGYGTGKETPLEIVKRRYAAGEIAKKEYDSLKKELEK